MTIEALTPTTALIATDEGEIIEATVHIIHAGYTRETNREWRKILISGFLKNNASEGEYRPAYLMRELRSGEGILLESDGKIEALSSGHIRLGDDYYKVWENDPGVFSITKIEHDDEQSDHLITRGDWLKANEDYKAQA